MTRKRKLQIAGLCLWSVQVKHSSGSAGTLVTTSLWITTPGESIKQAQAKAERFVNRNFERAARILKIEYRGYLDA